MESRHITLSRSATIGFTCLLATTVTVATAKADTPAGKSGPPVLSDYDPAWPVHAAQLLALVRDALVSFDPAGDAVFEHIGSTAVPGLAAKPILDLQAQVAVLPPLPDLIKALAAIGFAPAAGARPDSPGVYRDTPRPGSLATPDLYEKWLFRSTSTSAILHIRLLDSPFADWVLLLRDWLRANPVAAIRYDTHKRALAERFADGDDYDDYTRAKTAYYDEIEPAARRWAAHRPS
ncbi:GrpB family protein [Nocardia sp. XZ_19_385]|uniref:GrpB family protein n=1 Tax=Nocardia sp. XZ_19_385 TaxID=2769488 RepID=UPI00188E14DD|nr:GrpB family protein [Nocardia sp. XZ_19_385]